MDTPKKKLGRPVDPTVETLRVRLSDLTPDQRAIVRALVEAARTFTPTQRESAARDKPADSLTNENSRGSSV